MLGCPGANQAPKQPSLTWLGTFGGDDSVAYDVSADGSMVVGVAYDTNGNQRAFHWTAGKMEDLGTLGGDESSAHDVSADGSVVVGKSNGRAFRWTFKGGMEDLNKTYAHLLTDGSELRAAYAISPNGRYIVGHGYNAATKRLEAFLLDTG